MNLNLRQIKTIFHLFHSGQLTLVTMQSIILTENWRRICKFLLQRFIIEMKSKKNRRDFIHIWILSPRQDTYFNICIFVSKFLYNYKYIFIVLTSNSNFTLFFHARYIYSLDLSNNQLSDPQAFKNIGYSLRILYLNGNNMSVLGNHAFGDLPFLEILHLASNNISSVRRRSFQGLPNLQELDLSHNKIDSLAVELFSNLRMLRSLKINYNLLKGLPRDVFLNTRMEHLDLSNNLVSIWPVNSFSVGRFERAANINK